MTLLQTDRNLSYVFQVLARCPKTSDEAAKQRIADTLVYQHGSLRVWYYTEPDSGEVLRRDRREWGAERILEVFSAKGGGRTTSPGVPIAFYVHYAAARGSKDNHNTSALTGAARVIELATKYCRQYGEDAEPLSVDYFDADTLRAFLGTRENKHNVILQKIVHGRADHASMIQVVWSPHRTLATQRQNTHSVTDVRVPLYQRTNTFDNTTHLSHEIRPTATMSSRLDIECRHIVEHIAAVEQRVVIRLVAFFAFDHRQDAVLLFVSELQLTSQPATQEQVRLALSTQLKRKLCMVSPQIIPSDVVFPSFAKVGGGPGNGGGSSDGVKVKGSSQFASAGMGGATLSLKASSTGSTTISGQLHASDANTFDGEMDVLDSTFASAYESRSERGRLNEAQRRVFFDRSVFSVHHVGAASWKDFEEHQRRKDQHRSYLQIGKRFYVPDPLLERRHKELPLSSFPNEQAPQLRPHSVASSLDARPTSPISEECSPHSGIVAAGRSRPSSATGSYKPQQRPTSSLRGHPKTRPSSSLVLQGDVRFCKGGGGGLFLRTPAPQRVSTASAADDDWSSDRWANGSATGDMYSSFSTDALASLRSPPHSPNKRPGSTASMPTMSLPLTPSIQLNGGDGFGFDPTSWGEWRRALKASAWYRRMVSTTHGSYQSLACGAPDARQTDNELAMHAKLEELRKDPGAWVDVELPDPTVSPLEKLQAATFERALPSVHRTMRTVNLWHLFHPDIGRDWVLWSTAIHRQTAEGIECLMSEVDRVFHTTSSLLGGLPSCDIRLPVCIELTDEFDKGAKEAIRNKLHDQTAAAHPTNIAAVRLPWWLSGWVLWSIVHPSQSFPPAQLSQLLREKAQLQKDSMDDDLSSAPPSLCCKSLRALSASNQTRLFNASQCSSLLQWVVADSLPANTSGSLEESLQGGASLHLSLRLPNVSAEYLHRVQAGLRSLLASVTSSWGMHGLVALYTIEDLTLDAIKHRAGPTSQKATALRRQVPSSSVTAREGQSASSFSPPGQLIAREAFTDIDGDEDLALSKQEWDVLQATCSAALQERSKALKASNVEWPPRMSFTK